MRCRSRCPRWSRDPHATSAMSGRQTRVRRLRGCRAQFYRRRNVSCPTRRLRYRRIGADIGRAQARNSRGYDRQTKVRVRSIAHNGYVRSNKRDVDHAKIQLRAAFDQLVYVRMRWNRAASRAAQSQSTSERQRIGRRCKTRNIGCNQTKVAVWHDIRRRGGYASRNTPNRSRASRRRPGRSQRRREPIIPARVLVSAVWSGSHRCACRTHLPGRGMVVSNCTDFRRRQDTRFSRSVAQFLIVISIRDRLACGSGSSAVR